LVEVGYGYELNGEHLFKRNDYIPYRTLNLFTNQRNMYSAFCTAYRYNTKDVSMAELYGDLYFDFDDIDSFEKVRADAITTLSYLKIVFGITENDVRLYFSGNKGLHIIVPAELLGVEPNKSLNGIYKTIANAIKSFTANKTLDTKIYDNKRLFRIPNTLHEKSNLYKIPITPEELKKLSEFEIKSMAASQRKINDIKTVMKSNKANKEYLRFIDEYNRLDKEMRANASRQGKKSYTFVPPCIEHLLKDGAGEGSRNISIACLAGFYKGYGKSLDEAIELISDWNDKNIKPTGHNEMTKTVRSIYNSDKQYGCSTLQSISKCDPECKIAKNRRKQNGQTNQNK
jgi:hypothetical protein